jgi:hypothetical protein
MNQEHAFCLATEKLLGIEVPKRGQLIRVLYCEIGRLLSHLLNVTPHSGGVSAPTSSACVEIGLVLDEFLGPAMQETNMRVNALYDLAVELEYKTQDADKRRLSRLSAVSCVSAASPVGMSSRHARVA